MSMLEGKVILITGASGGIGRETALTLGKAGAKVMLLDRDTAAVEAAAQEIRKAGVSAEAVPVDVTDEAKVSEAIDGIVARHSRLDGAFNNAGIEQSNKPLHEIELGSWSRILSVDLTGVTRHLAWRVYKKPKQERTSRLAALSQGVDLSATAATRRGREPWPKQPVWRWEW